MPAILVGLILAFHFGVQLVHPFSSQEHIRLVGLSATLPNYEDVAVFLRVCILESTFLVETLRDSPIILFGASVSSAP